MIVAQYREPHPNIIGSSLNFHNINSELGLIIHLECCFRGPPIIFAFGLRTWVTR